MARISPGALFVIIILLLLFLNPGSTPGSGYEARFISSVITSERASLRVLEGSTFEQSRANSSEDARYLNLTGLRADDGFSWHLLPSVKSVFVNQRTEAAGEVVVNVEDGTSNSSLLLFQNVTGWAKGSWVKSTALEEPVPRINETSLSRRIGKSARSVTHNITGSEGKIFVSIKERNIDDWVKNPGDTKSVYARVTIQDATSFADGWVFRMHGLQNLKSGSLMLTTTSDEFSGIFALPQLALSQQSFNRSKLHLVHSLDRTIELQESEKSDFTVNPWGESSLDSDDASAAPRCELIAYFQQHPLSPGDVGRSLEDGEALADYHANEEALDKLEDEIRSPKGLMMPALPSLHFSATLFSPDCGYLLTTKGPPQFVPQDGQHLVGPRFEVRVERARTAMLLFVFTIVGQLVVLIGQINAANTPSKRSRISFWSLTILSLGTGFVSFAFLLLSSNVMRLFILALTIAFVAFLDGLFFTMRFLLEVWTVQEPERLERHREQQRRNETASAVPASRTPTDGPAGVATEPPSSPHPIDTGAAAMALPMLNNAVTPGLPATNTVNTSTGPTFGSLYTRYCLFLLSMVFLSIWAASSWPRSVRSFYANALVFAYLSFWLPQIHRNIIRNCRKALTKRFIVGQSILRLFPIAYLWGYEDNVLFVDTDTRMLIVFAGWLWIQMLILASQEVIGPRFFVSERWSWIPAAWEYHPILREDEEGATLPLGYASLSRRNSSDPSSIESFTKSDDDGQKVFDCAICMQQLRVPVVPSGDSPPGQSSAADVLSGGFMSRRHYSVTPCRHIFHSSCLESWIGYRLQCPICRENLPPL